MPSVQVCQQAGSDRNPAGSKDTSFSVDSSGNVVILYGKITDSASTPHTRYSAAVFTVYRVVISKLILLNKRYMCCTCMPSR